MLQGAIQTIHAKHGFRCIQHAGGGDVFSHRSALTPLESCAPWKSGEVRIGVEFAPEPGPKGLHAARITGTPIKISSVLSFKESAAYFQRHAAG